MLAMVVDGLKKTGLKEFQVSIGHVDLFRVFSRQRIWKTNKKKRSVH